MKKILGFTMVEILLVMGVFAVLASFVSINLIRPQTKASVDLSVNTLVADLKEAQLKSMVGDSEGQSSAQNYGIYFGSNSYTIFRGATYSPSDTSNFVVNLDSPQTMSNSFSGSQVVFTRISGEVVSFTAGANTITITDSAGSSKTITINYLGSLTIN